MRHVRTFAAAAAAAAALAGALALAGAEEAAPSAAATSRLVTLHAGDPVTHTLDLVDGTFGAEIQGVRLVEGRAHLDYGNYADDALSIGLDEDDRGLIVDLGHWADLSKGYDYEEADGGGIGFASICCVDGEIKIARRLPKDSFQALREARPLLTQITGERRASVHPVPGHVYLVRVEDRHRRSAPVYAKFLVVSHDAGVRVTLRWDRIPGL